ncbi:MAG: DNA Pol III Epsilon Chain [Cytophagales bacterium]|jgi:DNA polymerase-3 subunit epsilon|nr:3'-5' exonuclease [Bacteroidota bacterium]MBS1981743.1 3'-5' exonuclease [Bacteroidota bacterium]WHZ09114.1 MAG: DNA Pol III Epsilon Chain [Cytophagales bacterium]
MKLNLKIPLCCFDLETTGVNASRDRIIEIAVIKIMPNGEQIHKTNLVNPTIPIPPESTAIHGITNDDVKDKPTFKEVAKEYARFMEGCDLAGFNILKFDVPLLVEEFLRAGVDFDYQRKKIIDAQRIFHLMEKRNLSSAYKFYCQKDLENAHSAGADTQASLEVLIAQISKYDGQDVTDGLNNKIGVIKNDMESLSKLVSDDLVDLAGRMVKNQKGDVIFNFGKHKNKLVQQVFKEEPAYYDWMMNGDFSLDTKRKLTEQKLNILQK